MESNKELFLAQAIKGFQLLRAKQSYKQINVLRKLLYLQYDVSAPSFTRVLGKNPPSKVDTIQPFAEGIIHIIQKELDFVFDQQLVDFVTLNTPDFQAEIIPELTQDQRKGDGDLVYNAAGRLPIAEKLAFMSKAETEVVEFGLRLRVFADYFVARNEDEFKKHIDALLKRGVNFKAYLLSPESQYARLYFDDRAKVLPRESRSINVMRDSVRNLKEIMDDYACKDYPGKFEVFIYDHLPYNHFLIVDGASRKNARMIVSHYIYGIRRSLCPTVTFSKSQNPDLYKRYWESFQHFSTDASPLMEWLNRFGHLDAYTSLG